MLFEKQILIQREYGPSPSRSTRAVDCDRMVRPSERLAEAGRAPLKSLHNPLPRFTPVPIRHMHQAGDPADQRISIAGAIDRRSTLPRSGSARRRAESLAAIEPGAHMPR